MNSEKESEAFEQAMIIWLLFAVAVLIVWAAAFASAVYLLKFTMTTSLWLWAAGAATLVAAGFVLAANKFLWK